eukprot:CAMPEP_0181373750 /NCGR_PEP_ID=MMETSP1106-20121128/15578_1 /TAXON_ID=81844 /ORGANISM="Mantoniella antarctica, Strain SL-175" /LENGTH=67 /DNA_ID=CAMNT_0023491535 /DNA_START=771 /DNA_END=971 /DNA_ORIENTATION=+
MSRHASLGAVVVGSGVRLTGVVATVATVGAVFSGGVAYKSGSLRHSLAPNIVLTHIYPPIPAPLAAT